MTEHARWLRLVPSLHVRRLPSGTLISFGWLLRPGADAERFYVEDADHLLAITYGKDLPSGLDDVSLDRGFHEGDVDAARALISLREGKVAVRLPHLTPEQWLVREEASDLVMANDFRILLRWSGLQIDPRAIWALFQYSAIPAPLTLDRDVRRVPNGHVCEVDLERGTYRTTVVPLFPDPSPDRASRDGEEAGRRTREALDSVLDKVPQGSTLLFSGGVDSGLLAVRLAETGRRDVLLLNYLLGEEDAHSRAAVQMAHRLGMRLEQVSGAIAEASAALERVATDYSAPFADPAVATTNQLVHASLTGSSPPPAIIDGTGADGAFSSGISPTVRWQRALRVPAPIRHVGGVAYEMLGSWRFESRVEKGLREMRALSTMSLLQAAVSYAVPLDGIAFHGSSEDRRTIGGAVTALSMDQTAHRSLSDQLAYLFLVQRAAPRAAAKTFDLSRLYGVHPIYPFLDPLLIRAAFSLSWSEKCRDGDRKSLLKEMLSQDVPAGLARLPKQGFVAPVADLLRQPRMGELMSDFVLGSDNPVREFVSLRVIRVLLRRIGMGKTVSPSARRFLWALLFTSMWVHGIRSEIPALD